MANNFIEEFKKGQSGYNKGLYMGNGLLKLNKELNGIQKGMHYIIAASPKVGKSTIVNYGWIIQPYLDAMEKNIPIEFVYFSFEMDRVSQEFEFATYFMYHDFGVKYIRLEGETYKGKDFVQLSSKYLRGRLQNDNDEIIKVKPEVEEILKEVYFKRIIPLFGEYSVDGILIKKGLIDFVEHKDNPTGLYKYLMTKASKEGTFNTIKYTVRNKDTQQDEVKEKIISYVPDNPDKYTIVVTDTIRKLPRERMFTMKDNIDKYLEYSTELSNLLGYSFANIIHLNRTLAEVNNLKFRKDNLFPSSDNLKDTGNAAEECDYLITIFNPNDDRYNLKTHFGKKIRLDNGDPIYPNLRTLHIVESRHSECPIHIPVEMEGHIKNFNEITL